MKILFSPQVNEEKIIYDFEGEKITATFRGVTDVFDFSDMPNGIVENPQEDIETSLEINPFSFVERLNGELKIELLNYIGSNATYEERFPEWFEVKDNGKD